MSNNIFLIKKSVNLKKLKAAEWEFKKFIPDQEDLYAKMKTLENVRNHLDSLNMNDGKKKFIYILVVFIEVAAGCVIR